MRQIPSKPPFLVNGSFVRDNYYNDINSMVIFEPSKEVGLLYVLACINSRLISVWFEKTYDKLQRKIFPQFKVKELATFPIRTINLDDPADKAKHDKLVEMVETMLRLHKELPGTMGQEKTVIERQIAATDTQIDSLVYALYGLTPEEIAIVEGAG